jgi:hypothetical protein
MTNERTPVEPDFEAPYGGAAEVVDVSPGEGAARLTATGSSRQRWLLAAAISAVVIAASALIAGLLGDRAAPEVLRYVSADALVVVELRPELPGDQRDRLAELLSHFPGFKDRTTLERKLDESFDLFVDRASNGAIDYATQVKPYLAGPAAIAMAAPTTATSPDPRFVAVLTTNGSADCRMPGEGAVRTESYRDVEILVPESGMPASCALDGRTAIFGAVEDVKRAIDTKRDGGSIVEDGTYTEAMSSLDGDHLGAVFVNARAVAEQALAAAPDLPTASLPIPTADIPSWVAMQVRAEGDALVHDGVASKPSGLTLPSGAAHPSNLAERLPDSTVVALEGHDVGETIRLAIAHLADDPATADMSQQLEDALRMIGGLDALTGWIKDAAIVGTVDGDEFGAGAVLAATDADKAAGTLASVRNLMALAGAQGGLTLREVDHGGTTIYVLDLGEAGSLFGLPTEHPVDGAAMKPQLAFAQRDDLVVIGVTEGFVEAVLDVGDRNALADNERYQRAIERAGASNRGQAFVDLATILEAYGERLSGDAAADWAANTKPWVGPFEALALSAQHDGDRMSGRLVITVR